ncbi:pyrroline-5-carboxylate reductase [Solirhodobacter olei]|uniref:pyrroline-5-carboxylate reductase n=1 Tax=Solirhodobacter olei TaxID=2493082 RepID=UPI000FDC49A7|nr:pyrroline-5-carboxylate reductase [Solirhodobacter olei]
MTPTVVLIGAGNMGFAMLEGWLKRMPKLTLHVVEPFKAFRQRAETAGAHAVAALTDLPTDLKADLVVVAVKPPMVAMVLADCTSLAARGAAFLSVAAGVRLASMRSALAAPAAHIRCMPNTPAAVGEGMMVLCTDTDLPPRIRKLTEALMASSGEVAWVGDEALMDAVTAISGSGPAYVFHFIEALTAAGLRLGLPEDVAPLLARQTVAGAGRMARDASVSPTVLRERVTSPSGTTEAALSILMADGALTELMARAATAARDRGVELGREG